MSAALETIDIPVWVKRGKMLLRTEYLAVDDPDHPYNYILRVYKVNPEDYGVENPRPLIKCPHCDEIIRPI